VDITELKNFVDILRFEGQVFKGLVEKREDFIAQVFDLKQELVLSYLFSLSGLQDSFSFRVQRRSLLLAHFLISEEAELKKEELEQLILGWEQTQIFYYPEGDEEVFYAKKIVAFLKRLQTDKNLFIELKKIRKPLCSKKAETLICETLGISEQPLSEAMVLRAVLSTCLAFLRQNVGSCFATAPAILIHEEEIDSFIVDVNEILSTGRLKRTIRGKEYAVPMSPSSGNGDLKKRILLSDQKMGIEFSPGLVFSFVAIGLLEKGASWEKQFSSLEALFLNHLKSSKVKNVEDLIHQVLLSHFDLNEEDLEWGKRFEREMARQKVQVLRHEQSAKWTKVQEMLDAEALAKKTFKGMTDNPLLKTWEFTLASFSEIKMEFSHWNLYSSLGLHPEEKGGIGEVLYRELEEKLEECNQKMEKSQKDYLLAFDQLRATETLLRRASSEREARRLQSEFQSRYYHMQSCLEMRDKYHVQAKHYSEFLAFLIQQYESFFQEYFQEIYDPEMTGFDIDEYEDRPAGFRLVYKHGRSDASLWSFIYNEEEWRNALIAFFLAVEPTLIHHCTWEKGKEEIPYLTTRIVHRLQDKEFFDSAQKRMLKAHAHLTSLDLQKKPWAYISGGTMSTLLKTYFRRENEITEESKKIDSEINLLIFILDTLKSLPPKITNSFLDDPSKAMLMHSPTHAFLLHPGWEWIRKGWQEESFSYTWVRDQFLLPGAAFFENMILEPEEQEFILSLFNIHLPKALSTYFQTLSLVSSEALSIKDFYSSLIHNAELFCRHCPGYQFEHLKERLEGFFYNFLPLISTVDLSHYLKELLKEWMNESMREVIDKISLDASFIDRQSLKKLAKSIFLLHHQSYGGNLDIEAELSKKAQRLGIEAPAPLLFADTNWPWTFFAFLVSPITLKIELWRTNKSGTKGFSMNSWKRYFDGSSKSIWTILTQPYEYARR